MNDIDGLIYRAARFASIAHSWQTRKDNKTPYITHPARVAKMLEQDGFTSHMVAAAWLHDVIEDTDATINDLYLFGFPEEVIMLVDELTKKENPAENRETRKAKEVIRLSNITNKGKTIKLADIIDNILDMKDMSEEFQATFMKEKSQVVEVLEGGNPDFLSTAKELIEDYYG